MEMVKSVSMTLVYCHIRVLAVLQLSVKSDSISFQDICAKSAKFYTGF